MTRQYAAVDVMKLVAAVGIIMLHCQLPYVAAITRIGLYFFFVASGYFLFAKCRQAATATEQRAVVVKFLRHIGRVYLVWSLLYFPLNLYEIYLGGDMCQGLLNYVRNFFLTGSYWQLWFLNGLWISVLLVALALKHGLSFRWLCGLALVPYSIALGYFNYRWVYDVLLAANGPLNAVLAALNAIWGSPINGLCLGVPFVTIGAYIGLRQPKYTRKQLWLFTMISTCAVFGEQIFTACLYPELVQGVYIFMPICQYFLFLLLLSLKIPYSGIFAHCRRLSMYLFYTHTYLIFAYSQCIEADSSLYRFIWVLVYTLAVSEAFTRLSTRIRAFRYLT